MMLCVSATKHARTLWRGCSCKTKSTSLRTFQASLCAQHVSLRRFNASGLLIPCFIYCSNRRNVFSRVIPTRFHALSPTLSTSRSLHNSYSMPGSATCDTGHKALCPVSPVTQYMYVLSDGSTCILSDGSLSSLRQWRVRTWKSPDLSVQSRPRHTSATAQVGDIRWRRACMGVSARPSSNPAAAAALNASLARARRTDR